MSGCYPTGDPCICLCHTSGLASIKFSVPSRPCCTCHVVNEEYKIILPTVEATHKLEEIIEKLDEIVNHITQEDMKAGRKPHRCPICNGTSFCKEGMECVPCQGTGIVWG